MKLVKRSHAMRMLEVLPPATWYKTNTGEIFQVGEAFDHVNGKPRFDTYQRIGKYWYYRGIEHKHKNKNNIMESQVYINA